MVPILLGLRGGTLEEARAVPCVAPTGWYAPAFITNFGCPPKGRSLRAPRRHSGERPRPLCPTPLAGSSWLLLGAKLSSDAFDSGVDPATPTAATPTGTELSLLTPGEPCTTSSLEASNKARTRTCLPSSSSAGGFRSTG